MSEEYVDAKVIDTDMSTISKAEQWLAGASERVAERCELYKPPKEITSDKQRKECAAARTQCRKDAAEIDNERKVILRDMEDALKKFKSEVKDVLSPLTDLDARYKTLLDDYEERWRTEREMELAEEYEALAPNLVPLVPFQRLMAKYGMDKGKVWLNRSTNVEAAKYMLADAVEKIAKNEARIDQLVAEEDRETVKALYFSTLDIEEAMDRATALMEHRRMVRQLEDERKAQEVMRDAEKPNTAPSEQPTTNVPPMPQQVPETAPEPLVPPFFMCCYGSGEDVAAFNAWCMSRGIRPTSWATNGHKFGVQRRG